MLESITLVGKKKEEKLSSIFETETSKSTKCIPLLVNRYGNVFTIAYVYLPILNSLNKISNYNNLALFFPRSNSTHFDTVNILWDSRPSLIKSLRINHEIRARLVLLSSFFSVEYNIS